MSIESSTFFVIPLKSLMARPKLMRPMASTRISSLEPLTQAGSTNCFSPFLLSSLPMYFPSTNTCA